MNKKIYYAIAMTMCCIIISCTTGTVYHHYIPIENKWMKADTFFFAMPDSMETGVYKTKIGVRHTVTYKYKDLWISIGNNENSKTDTVHLELANKRGNWNSNGTASGYYQYEIQGPDIYHKQGQDSIIKIWHIMKDASIENITDVGIKIYQ